MNQKLWGFWFSLIEKQHDQGLIYMQQLNEIMQDMDPSQCLNNNSITESYLTETPHTAG